MKTGWTRFEKICWFVNTKKNQSLMTNDFYLVALTHKEPYINLIHSIIEILYKIISNKIKL